MVTRKAFATPHSRPLTIPIPLDKVNSQCEGLPRLSHCAASGRHVDRIFRCALITVRQFLNAPLAGIFNCLPVSLVRLPLSLALRAWQICTFLLCAL